jgi:hypothetical protein
LAKILFALINQMTMSQTRLRTSLIAALVNREVPLTFTLVAAVVTLVMSLFAPSTMADRIAQTLRTEANDSSPPAAAQSGLDCIRCQKVG